MQPSASALSIQVAGTSPCSGRQGRSSKAGTVAWASRGRISCTIHGSDSAMPSGSRIRSDTSRG